MTTPPPTEAEALAPYAHAVVGALRAANIGICVTVDVDTEPRNAFVNEPAVTILGRSREWLLSMPFMEVVAPEARAGVADYLRKQLDGAPRPDTVETSIVRADGKRVPVVYALSDQVVSGRRALVSLFWDASAQHEAADALRAEGARLRRVIESAPDGIVVSRNGVVLDANAAAARMLGFAAGHEMIGASLHSMMSQADTRAMVDRVAQGMRGDRLAPRTYEAQRRDGKKVIAEITSVPYEHDGQPAVMGFARDVTDRVRLEAQLAESERLAAIGTLAAGVAHEINNPVTAMSLGLRVLTERVEKLGDIAGLDHEAQHELGGILDDLRAGLERVASVIRELRVFSRTDDDEAVPTDVTAALSAAQRVAAHQVRHHATVVTHFEPVPLVLGQAHKLERIFVNLLVNAAHALGEKGTHGVIVIHTSLGPDGRVHVAIRDDGAGMTAEVRARALDPFFTTKPIGVGTGLGLAISHGIVRRFGGELTIESEPGRGTTVHVFLRPAEGASLPAPVRPVSPTPPRVEGRLRVLVVDDEPSLATSLRILLSEDHDVTAVTDGTTACELLVAQAAPFDVVLCDVTMPIVSGIDVFTRVTTARPDMQPRFVFMTGGALTTQAAEFLASRTGTVLEKPFSLGQVLQMLADVHSAARKTASKGT